MNQYVIGLGIGISIGLFVGIVSGIGIMNQRSEIPFTGEIQRPEPKSYQPTFTDGWTHCANFNGTHNECYASGNQHYFITLHSNESVSDVNKP